MSKKLIYSDYDIFADIYNKHWGHFQNTPIQPIINLFYKMPLPTPVY